MTRDNVKRKQKQQWNVKLRKFANVRKKLSKTAKLLRNKTNLAKLCKIEITTAILQVKINKKMQTYTKI